MEILTYAIWYVLSRIVGLFSLRKFIHKRAIRYDQDLLFCGGISLIPFVGELILVLLTAFYAIERIAEALGNFLFPAG